MQRLPQILLALAIGFLLVKMASGQTPFSQPVAAAESVQQTFQWEQQALAQEMEGITDPGQLDAWHNRNADRLAAQQERAKVMAADSALKPMPLPPPPRLPANASPALKEFLTARAKLARAQVQIHNALVDALPLEVTEEQVQEMQKKETQLFQQQQSGELQAQAQRAKILADESARHPMPIPPPLRMPAGISPEMKAFLTQRDQLLREQIQLRNRYATDEPAVREAAMRQWMEQNAGRFGQMPQSPPNTSKQSKGQQP